MDILRRTDSLGHIHAENQFGRFQSLGDRIYEMRCLFVAVGLNALFIVLPHWDNMSRPTC